MTSSLGDGLEGLPAQFVGELRRGNVCVSVYFSLTIWQSLQSINGSYLLELPHVQSFHVIW
jgi:hypothetical protein